MGPGDPLIEDFSALIEDFSDYRTSEWVDDTESSPCGISRVRKMHLRRLERARKKGKVLTLSTSHHIKLARMEDTILNGSIFCARQLLKETLE